MYLSVNKFRLFQLQCLLLFRLDQNQVEETALKSIRQTQLISFAFNFGFATIREW